MKLVTFEIVTPQGPSSRLGALVEQGVVDLNLAAGSLIAPDMLAFLDRGEEALAQARQALDFAAKKPGDFVHALKDVRLLAPLQPRSLRDFFAYEEHAKQAAARGGAPHPKPARYQNPIHPIEKLFRAFAFNVLCINPENIHPGVRSGSSMS